VSLAVVVVILLMTACTGPRPDETADLVALGGVVHTSDPETPIVEAFAIRDGRFIATGSTAEIKKLAGKDTTVIELEGVTVLPGLIDGHVHLGSGLSLMRGVNLYGIADRNQWFDRIAAKAAELPKGTWIVGGRWDHTLTRGAALPTKQELDAIVPDHPVALADVDGHSTWVNSLALEIGGVDASTPNPQGGEIVHDPKTGEPTGILLETASELVRSKIPDMSDEQRLEAIRQTLEFANSLGLTGAHDMSNLTEDYIALAQKGELTLRLWIGTWVSSPAETTELMDQHDSLAAQLENAAPGEKFGPMLELGYVKLMADGVLSTRTAYLLEPYSDAPGETGLPTCTSAELNEMVAASNTEGFPVAIHAIGDAAVRMSLDAYEASLSRPRLPNRIEHIEVIDPTDVGRFAELGVLASMNPHHCITGIDKYNTARVGAERVPWTFAWNKLNQAGAKLVFGTDWATAPLSPLEQLYAAVLREKPEGGPKGGWYPENKVSFQEALLAYTQAGADAAGWGDQIGSITPGKWADFVILDAALPEPLDRSILDRSVKATYLGGRKVYSAR
jgi:predicted amidohydrolase YtcJ